MQHLVTLGPALVIQATKRRTRLTAEALAEGRTQDDELAPSIRELVELVEARMGEEHPLREVLRCGVAYHHGSLPSEIRHGIEDALSSGDLEITVATTTMTEGVNLPVRSVIIGSQGHHRDGEFVEHIIGSRLLNAVGRAGRAAKETEGIVVLARFKNDTEEDFERLQPDQEELRVDSWLASREALDNLASFEEMVRNAEDAVLNTDDGPVGSFLSYVWFIASELERLELPLEPEEVAGWLRATLGWVQLDEVDRQRWLRAAESALQEYDDTEPTRRRRWARSGTGVATAARLDELSQEVAEELITEGERIDDWVEMVLFLIRGDRLGRILEASEASDLSIHTRRGRGREEIALDLHVLIRDWLEGAELEQLANNYLAAVTKPEYRFQQLGDLISELFELHLPWMLRVIIDWTNEILEQEGYALQVPEDVPSLVRWGVPSPYAAQLMNMGLSSRSFAVTIAEEWEQADTDQEVDEWIRRLPREEWRERFDATVGELRNLVSILRPQSDNTLMPFLEGETVTIAIEGVEGVEVPPGTVEIPMPPEDWAPIELRRGEQVIGTIPGGQTQDVRAILQMGLEFDAEVIESHGEPVLCLELQMPV